MTRPLGSVWPPWGRGPSPGHRCLLWGHGPSPGPRVAAVGVWPVTSAPCGRRGGMACILGLCDSRGRVAGPLVNVWPTWGRIRSPGPRMAAMGAWPVPWASYGCRGGVVGPLGPILPPWVRGRSPRTCMAAVGAWPVLGPRMATLGAWPVPLAPCSRCRGVAGTLGPVWPHFGRGPSPGPCMAAEQSWPVPGPRRSAVGA